MISILTISLWTYVCICVCVTENLHHSLVSVLPSKSVSRYGYKLLCFFILLLISFPLHERLFANEGELLGKSECVSVCVCAIWIRQIIIWQLYIHKHIRVCVCVWMMHTNVHFILFASWHFSLSIPVSCVLSCLVFEIIWKCVKTIIKSFNTKT